MRYNLPVGWDQVTVIIVTVVLAGTFYNNRRIDDVNRRFDDVSRRFDGVNARFDDVRRRIDDLRADVNARFAHVDTQLGELRRGSAKRRGLSHQAATSLGASIPSTYRTPA